MKKKAYLANIIWMGLLVSLLVGLVVWSVWPQSDGYGESDGYREISADEVYSGLILEYREESFGEDMVGVWYLYPEFWRINLKENNFTTIERYRTVWNERLVMWYIVEIAPRDDIILKVTDETKEKLGLQNNIVHAVDVSIWIVLVIPYEEASFFDDLLNREEIEVRGSIIRIGRLSYFDDFGYLGEYHIRLIPHEIGGIEIPHNWIY